MKLLFTLFLLFLPLQANHIDDFAIEMDYETSYDKALQKANKEHKILMLVLVSNYCSWCRKLERTTLSSDLVNDVIEDDFVALILDKNAHNYDDKFIPPLVPTTHFINPNNQKIIKTKYGYDKKENFYTLLKKLQTNF